METASVPFDPVAPRRLPLPAATDDRRVMGSSGGVAAAVGTVRVETVARGGVVTAKVSGGERRSLNPETLPQAPTGFVLVPE